MNVDLLNDFKETKTCTYKGERYSVRDNGAVFRHAREGKEKRRMTKYGHSENLTSIMVI